MVVGLNKIESVAEEILTFPVKKGLEAKKKSLERPRLPVVIQLRDYAKVLTSESLFSDFFFRRHEIPLPGYSAFEYLNRIGKFLLIFDGFDEMADKLDRQKMINNFWELARVVVPGAKAIWDSFPVTLRTWPGSNRIFAVSWVKMGESVRSRLLKDLRRETGTG